jgi:sterol desaturase/sphingolipid hydroxylase (fatty acid hydroxylase superfamily)
LDLNLIVLSIPIFFFLIGLEVLYDRISKRELYRFNDALSNISCGITEQISGVFAKVFTIAAYDLIFQNFRFFDVPATWYWWVLAFIGVDFFYYWAHRLSHEINLFWAGHVVHHQSEEYNLSVALRQGAFQKLFTFYFYFPLAFLGFSTEWFLSISAINLLYQFWIHTEAINKMPVFSWVFNTPSHHRVHHGRDPKYIDKNHGGTFIIWDRLFGTYQEEEEKPNFGVTRQLGTFNPLYAQVTHFVTLGKDLKKMKGIREIWSLLWNKPGWHPQRMGGVKEIPLIEKASFRKYDVRAPLQLNIYIFCQYLIALGITSLFLFTQGQMHPALKASFTFWIFYTVASLGLLSDGRSWAIKMEWGRVFLTLAFGLGLLIWSPILWLTALFLLSGLISWLWFFRVRNLISLTTMTSDTG